MDNHLLQRHLYELAWRKARQYDPEGAFSAFSRTVKTIYDIASKWVLDLYTE